MEELSKKELITEIETLKSKLKNERQHNELIISDREFKIRRLENEKQLLKDVLHSIIEKI